MTIDTTPVFGELQNISPSAIIELFELELIKNVHYVRNLFVFEM